MVYEEWSEFEQYRVADYPGEGYILSLPITVKAGMKPDLADIRVSDGTDSTLSFWIEPFTAGVESSAIINIRLGRSPDIFLHYGNPDAVSESNGSATFTFFDDFSDGFNTVKWNALSGSWTVSNGICSHINTGTRGVLNALTTTDNNYVFKARIRVTSVGGNGSSSCVSCKQVNTGTTYYAYAAALMNTTGNPVTFMEHFVTAGSQVDSKTWSLNTWQNLEIAHDGTNIKARVDDNTWYNWARSGRTGYFGFQNDRAGSGTQSMQIDYAHVRKYVATEPTAVYVSSHAKPVPLPLFIGLHFTTGSYLSAQAGSSISKLDSIGTWTGQFNRDSEVHISQNRKIESVVSKSLHKFRESDSFCEKLEDIAELTTIATNSFALCFIPKNKFEATTQSTIARPADVSVTKPESYIRTAFWGMRTADSFAETVSSEASKKGIFYRPCDNYLPAVKSQVKTESVFSRESSDNVSVINSDISWKGTFKRNSEFSSNNLQLSGQAFRGTIAQADIEITKPEFIVNRLLTLNRPADNTMPALVMNTKVTLISNPKVSSAILNLYTSCTVTSVIERSSDSSVPNLSSIVSHSLVFDRELSSSVTATETAGSVISSLARDSGSFLNSPFLTGLAELNQRTLYYPYSVLSTIFDYSTEVLINPFAVSLSKDSYFVYLQGGVTMLELTQYDTETIFGTLQDTDPETGELRLMPLSGKTVKLVLKGGNPEVTVIADSTVTGAGAVRTDLTSADLAIPGKYYLKYIILGTDYRKEIPDNRDEFVEVVVNEASYPA